jgi:serine/threonine protein kinase
LLLIFRSIFELKKVFGQFIYRQMDESAPEAEILNSLAEHEYQLRDLIGSGHFASVYTVMSVRYQEIFCAKIIRRSGREDYELTFRQEIDTLKNLTHPNIISIFAEWSSSNYLYLVLEFCPNGSLADMLEREKYLSGANLVDLMRQLVDAMAYCHSKRICHRDIKPANILIDKYGRPKLADFGFASLEEERKNGKFCGSLPYMSPELIVKSEGDPFPCDVWALGITFYHMAVGHLPWSETTKGGVSAEIAAASIVVPPDVPRKVCLVLKGMLDSDPERRSTMEQVLAMPCFDKTEVASGNLGKIRNVTSGFVPVLQSVGFGGGLKAPILTGRSVPKREQASRSGTRRRGTGGP